MKNLILLNVRYTSNMINQNKKFIDKIKKYKDNIQLHQSVSKIKTQQVQNHIASQPRQQLASKIAQNATYDQQLKDFISKFNKKHQGNVTLLDFSNYATSFGQMKNQPLRKGDLQMLQQFQKRKAEKQIESMKKKYSIQNMLQGKSKPIKKSLLSSYKEFQQQTERSQEQALQKNPQDIDLSSVQGTGGVTAANEAFSEMGDNPTSGPFRIKDDFVILLLHRGVTTKITTLNRINSFRVLLFMGNGNGIISHAKGKGASYQQAMAKSITLLQKNVIALPRDQRCTLPLHITTKFQDYKLYLRPLPGFNSWGYPNISLMLTLAGMDHCGFNVSHTGKNIYNAVHVIFKALTKNTTPQELAQRQGFKVYRHQFVRPLTFVQTHSPISK